MNIPTLSPNGKQTTLEALLIMAYNVGREHGEKKVMTIAEGRRAVLELQKLVERIDPGDLAKTMAENSLI